MSWFDEYRSEFERRVIVAAVTQGELGVSRDVSVQPGKLDEDEFGKKMGDALDTELLCVLDYYGYMKKSRGFQIRVLTAKRALRDWPIRALEAPVVHFAGVRLELVAELAPDLVRGFVRFKRRILDLRGFKHNLTRR